MSCLALTCALIVAAAAAPSGIDVPLDIPRLTPAPEIDGTLGEGEWGEAAFFKDFRDTGKNQSPLGVPAGLRTETWIGRTDAALCFAFRCYHDRMAQLATAVTEHDGPVWVDDGVEVFLDAHGTRYGYYHVIANVAGVLTDAYNSRPKRRDAGWDSGARAAGRLSGDHYTIEISIPYVSLNLGLNRKGVVTINLCRNVRYNVGRQVRFGGFHAPATWQAFRLGDAGPERFPAVIESMECSPLAGDNEFRAKVRNAGTQPLLLKGTYDMRQAFKHDQRVFRLRIAAGSSSEVRFPYTVTDKGEARFCLALSDEAGRQVLYAPRIVKPRPLAEVTIDSDLVLRTDRPRVRVALNVPRRQAGLYAVRLRVCTPDGDEVLRSESKPSSRRQFDEVLDVSKAPAAVSRLLVQAHVLNRKTGETVLRSVVPLRVLPSPWVGPVQ